MNFRRATSSHRRVSRRNHFQADASKRRVIMSSGLSRELREKYGIRSLPIKKDDEVKVIGGKLKDKTGRVIKVNRTTYQVFLDISYKDLPNGQVSRYGVNASKLQITGLDMKNSREKVIENAKTSNRKK